LRTIRALMILVAAIALLTWCLLTPEGGVFTVGHRVIPLVFDVVDGDRESPLWASWFEC
jgi:hypothetical protein